jgi:5'(3')-deoxyribonucleotidase
VARIAVDMDEVIADALGEHIIRYNRTFNGQVVRETLHGKRIYDVIPREHHAGCVELVFTEDFFADLDVLPGAQEVLQRLSQNHEIFITTAAMEVPKSFNAKYHWLLRHFPFISPLNFVFCGNKGIIAADYLIDDNPRHFKHFQGEGILFDAPANQHVTGYRRVKNWFEVEALFSASNAKVGV